MRYSTDKPAEDGNKAQEELVAVKMTEDDAQRLIPMALQRKLLDMLVFAQPSWKSRWQVDAARAVFLLGTRSLPEQADAPLDDSIEDRSR